MKSHAKVLLFAFSLLLTNGQAVFAGDGGEIVAGKSKGMALTIYNQNFGVVKDIRELDLQEGANDVRFEDVASTIDPTSVSFQSLTAPNAVQVLEQNYQYDLLSPQTLLSKSIGKTLKLKRHLDDDKFEEISGVILNAPAGNVNSGLANFASGIVIKTDQDLILNPSGEMHLSELPEGLISKPSLLWKLASTKAGKHNTEITYQASGINWHCDYVCVVNADDSQSDWTSWVTIDNKSGATYKQASLKLVAGDVHRVSAHDNMRVKSMETMAAYAAPAVRQFQEESFAEYHLYSLKGKTTVANNETKQMNLFSANKVNTKKLFVVDASNGQYYDNNAEKPKVNVKLEIQNSEASHLGMPMPKGKVRVYKRDSDDALQFIGEDLIEHTPKDEKIRVYIGDAFDIVAERKQTNVQNVSNRISKASYEISLRNHKKDAVNVNVLEHSHGQWKIVESSLPYKKKDSTSFEFDIPVAANSQVKLTYTIEVRY